MSSTNDNKKGVMDAVGADGAAAPTAANRRRSSVTAGQKFGNLHDQKRNSTDAAAAARKASFAEQLNPPGLLGGLWQNFTKGTGK